MKDLLILAAGLFLMMIVLLMLDLHIMAMIVWLGMMICFIAIKIIIEMERIVDEAKK